MPGVIVSMGFGLNLNAADIGCDAPLTRNTVLECEYPLCKRAVSQRELDAQIATDRKNTGKLMKTLGDELHSRNDVKLSRGAMLTCTGLLDLENFSASDAGNCGLHTKLHLHYSH